MDPVTIILAALATAGGKVAGQALGEAYGGLKRLILQKFGSQDGRLEQHLDDYVDDPETYEKPAAKALRETGAANDEELVERAIEVLRQAEQVQPGVTGGMVGQINAKGVVVANTVYGGVHFGDSR